MTTFTRAIVRRPSPSMIEGLTSTTTLGVPNYEKALQQHEQYVNALRNCGVAVTILSASDEFPDSCFVEDPVLLTEHVAILTRPGARTRCGEVDLIEPTIRSFYSEEKIKKIHTPGTLEAGDVMQVNNHFYIGLSARTNQNGAEQLMRILQNYGYTASTITLKTMLHLKTGVSFLGNNTFLLADEAIQMPEFKEANRIVVDDNESYAANAIMINGTVIVPLGFHKTAERIKALNLKIQAVDVSEFRKLDGGLSCLSLRF